MKTAHVEIARSVLIPLELWSKAAKILQKNEDLYQEQIVRGWTTISPKNWNRIKTDELRLASKVNGQLKELLAFEEENAGNFCNMDFVPTLKEYGWM